MTRFHVRPEMSRDADAIRNVNRRAFGGEGEPDLVDGLRSGGYVVVSVVATLAGKGPGNIVGHALFSEVTVESAEEEGKAVALAPVAVLPEFQRGGIGSSIIRYGIEACRDAGYGLVLVLGDPAYYSRFGFLAELAKKLESEYAGDHFMALRLSGTGPACGSVHYPPTFG